jgi:hypothetical protein
MTVGQIAIAFKACGKEFASDFETLEHVEKTHESVTKLFFSALGVDFYEFKKATDVVQKKYGLSHVDVLNIIDYVNNELIEQGGFLCALDMAECDFIDGFYEDVIKKYVKEMFDDIFECSEIQYNKAYRAGVLFTFEGGPDFIEAIKKSGFEPLIKIVKASAPNLDFSDKA